MQLPSVLHSPVLRVAHLVRTTEENKTKNVKMTLQEENAELQGLVGSLEAQLKLAQAHLAEEQVRTGPAHLP